MLGASAGNHRFILTEPGQGYRFVEPVQIIGGPEQDAVAAGKALNVGSVLEGYIQRQGARVRVNARLLAIPDGTALWAGTFDTGFSDVFAMQDAISEKVTAALSLKLDRDERRRMQRNYTSNVLFPLPPEALSAADGVRDCSTPADAPRCPSTVGTHQ